jgi:phage gp36-like protein
VDEAIALADAEIDAYCGGRYRVPVSPVPELLKKLSLDIAIYGLYSRKVTDISGIRAERYGNALKELEAISKGLISLGAPDTPEEADTPSGAKSKEKAAGNVFSRGSMEGY